MDTTIIPISIVNGAKNPMKPSGCCPTRYINKKLIVNKTNPIDIIITFFFENLS